jgi:hypothetical protein
MMEGDTNSNADAAAVIVRDDCAGAESYSG